MQRTDPPHCGVVIQNNLESFKYAKTTNKENATN